MSRGTVRAAIQAYLQQASTPGLNTITRTLVGLSPDAYVAGSDSAGAAGFVWITRDVEQVISMGGGPSITPNGWRQVTYNANLIFDYRVLQAAYADDSWADGLDDMVESVKTALRADPTLGTYGTPESIFLAADDAPDENLPSITVILEDPLMDEDSNTINVHGSIDFPVRENVPPGPATS